jgi:NRAMP (natural resistance-associated macrophage protein)-like metal ion transporter
MTKKQRPDPDQDIERGMVVKATRGDLGEDDISKPKVTDVVEDGHGNVKKFVVEKGVVFKKKLDIPADRVQSVDEEAETKSSSGTVVVDVGKQEVADLAAVGEEALAPEKQHQEDLLDRLEREIPTAEGLRELEARPEQAADEEAGPASTKSDSNIFLRVLGPGFLSGMAGNDASAVTSYSVDGATNGYGHLWLLLLSTPLYQSVQFACAKIGRISQKGLAEVLREHYSRGVAIIAACILILANIALIAADLVAIGSGLELITHVSWVWFVLPVGASLWYITVYRNFETVKKIFIALSLVFVVYIITAIFSRANWGAVVMHTFVPHVDFGFASISSAVALLGATISPYTMFWQVQGEKEEKRRGEAKQQLREAALDIGSGVVSGNLVSFFIIVCTAATLYAHHQGISTAADAAKSLQPLLGPFAEYLFAIGFIGAGIVAIPVLLASTSYAVAGTFGWPAGLSKKPWQNEGFYLILSGCSILSIGIAFLRVDPIQLMFWANVLNGVLSPLLVVYVIIIGNNRKIMGNSRLHIITNIGLVVTALVMFAATVLLFYGLATGQGG